MDIQAIANSLKNCPCGRRHNVELKAVEIASGLKDKCAEILIQNRFPRTILVVADKNTLAAAKGIVESLADFSVEYKVYDDLRVADMRDVTEIEQRICGRDVAVLSVGSGSLNDVCRLAAARQENKLGWVKRFFGKK